MSARITQVWLLLSAVTMLSWLFGSGDYSPNALITVGILAIAFVKARFIIRYFMDVRTAPIWLRRFTDIWLATLSATILAMYLY